MMNKRVGIRSVWQHNLDSEFALVKDALADYPFVSFETKFPFTLFEVDSPEDQYQIMKDSVNVRNIIQLRLTLSDGDGNLPDFCTDCCYVWEFNFRDFDIYRDFHSEDANAIELLKGQGIDFLRNKAKGILSSDFVTMMLKSRMTQDRRSRLTWVTCPGFYDLGYLIKILHWEELPNDVDSFMKLVDRYLGKRVYEFKSLPERLSLDWFRAKEGKHTLGLES
ncbi:putative CCR4-associated factor 1 homolog 11 [Prunus yedoensis var. nudiflora]|uniref:poly(A)-specific ribonuclease n=1 Tax=Prunus yedoensis var. nudiflora TaxID=2094558 RepID=A0A314UTU3_PRUYE|nr:putative CCR4-associated factor 1 homolog 11 [Prunus yedoensis var. nudiflora]